MPCGNWGATLSKSAYAAEKQAFLEQVRRRGLSEPRTKRTKRPPAQLTDADAQLQLHEMQLDLDMAGIGELGVHSVPELGHDFAPDVNQNYYAQVQQYDLSHDAATQHDGNSNLFEINPRAATIHQQLQKLQTATREHDATQSEAAFLESANPVFAPTAGEPYVPTMYTIDNLMNGQHTMRADQQREAEEAAVVRARQTETSNQQKRVQEVGES